MRPPPARCSALAGLLLLLLVAPVHSLITWAPPATGSAAWAEATNWAPPRVPGLSGTPLVRMCYPQLWISLPVAGASLHHHHVARPIWAHEGSSCAVSPQRRVCIPDLLAQMTFSCRPTSRLRSYQARRRWGRSRLPTRGSSTSLPVASSTRAPLLSADSCFSLPEQRYRRAHR